MSDEDVAKAAKENGTTRAVASMEKASKLEKDVIFAVGNAPTALIELDKLIKNGQINPIAIIGVPVGFVNVVQAKELIMTSGVPYIVARGRKGGSNVAAAICNAIIYDLKPIDLRLVFKCFGTASKALKFGFVKRNVKYAFNTVTRNLCRNTERNIFNSVFAV